MLASNYIVRPPTPKYNPAKGRTILSRGVACVEPEPALQRFLQASMALLWHFSGALGAARKLQARASPTLKAAAASARRSLTVRRLVSEAPGVHTKVKCTAHWPSGHCVSLPRALLAVKKSTPVLMRRRWRTISTLVRHPRRCNRAASCHATAPAAVPPSALRVTKKPSAALMKQRKLQVKNHGADYILIDFPTRASDAALKLTDPTGRVSSNSTWTAQLTVTSSL
jgi:hypothetical protein